MIKLQIPSITAKLLTSNENVDAWTAKIWAVILKDVRIVVSTPQVLYDALCHGFMNMDRLALVIFDEGLFP